MAKKCACGGVLKGKNTPDISYDPIQQCQECGTVVVNEKVVEQIKKEKGRKRYL